MASEGMGLGGAVKLGCLEKPCARPTINCNDLAGCTEEIDGLPRP
jgi:hypothetical protein